MIETILVVYGLALAWGVYKLITHRTPTARDINPCCGDEHGCIICNGH